MPQMAPMFWSTLMMMFILCLLIMNTMMYFEKNYKTKKVINSKGTMTKKWKW